jgi:hypothetical protein
MPLLGRPFKITVVASSDDPWCGLPKAKSFAFDWNAQFISIGDWPQGHEYLAALT